LRRKAGTRQGRGQPSRGLVLVHVTRLELDQVYLGRLADAFQVAASQNRSLAQVGAEVVDQDPAIDVTSLG
jgi:hypothetical protein